MGYKYTEYSGQFMVEGSDVFLDGEPQRNLRMATVPPTVDSEGEPLEKTPALIAVKQREATAWSPVPLLEVVARLPKEKL